MVPSLTHLQPGYTLLHLLPVQVQVTRRRTASMHISPPQENSETQHRDAKAPIGASASNPRARLSEHILWLCIARKSATNEMKPRLHGLCMLEGTEDQKCAGRGAALDKVACLRQLLSARSRCAMGVDWEPTRSLFCLRCRCCLQDVHTETVNGMASDPHLMSWEVHTRTPPEHFASAALKNQVPLHSSVGVRQSQLLAEIRLCNSLNNPAF